MPTFDIVSKIDQHEVANAVDQANRTVSTRFDFKDVHASFALTGDTLVLHAETDFQLKQMQAILIEKFAKRQLDVRSLDYNPPELSHKKARQEIKVMQGIPQEIAKKMVKLIKENKALKVQVSIQGDYLRATGKKRDALQAIIALLKKADFKIALQFENFRD